MRILTNKSLIAQIGETIFRRKLLIASVFTLVVASGMFVTFLTTPRYEAEMSILISRDRTDPRISAADKLPDIIQASISDEEFNSELELFKSREVIAGAVKDLDLVNNQAPKNDAGTGSLRERFKSLVFGTLRSTAKAAETKITADEYEIEKAINRVSGNLDVTPIKKSRIIKITYSDTDPLRAKQTLEKIYEKYAELHVQINEKVQAGRVFKEQTETFNRKLNAASNSLKQFDSRNGVSGAEIGVQRELLLKQLYDAQAQINAARTEIGETQKRIAALQEKIAAQPEQIQTGSVSKYVSALDRMKEELIQLEQQKTQYLQKYQPNSRFVRETQERIEQLKKSIAQETANPPQERSFALNDLRRRLESDLANAQTSLAAVKEREKNLSSQAEKLRGQVVLLNSRSIDRAKLERERSVNEEAYLLYQKKARENEISQALNKEQVMNFGVVDQPSTDGEPKSPKPLLNLLILMAIGASAGFASAIVLDKLTVAPDDYDFIVSPYEIERHLGLPVLAIISVIEPPREKLVSKPKRLALPPFFNKKAKNRANGKIY